MPFVLIGLGVGLVLAVIRFLIVNIPRFEECKEITDKGFVCPNCGKEFSPAWQSLIFKLPSVYSYNVAKLKCPACKERDMCAQKMQSSQN